MTHCTALTAPITTRQINPANTKNTPPAMKEGYAARRA